MNWGEHLTARAFTAFWWNRQGHKSESEGDLLREFTPHLGMFESHDLVGILKLSYVLLCGMSAENLGCPRAEVRGQGTHNPLQY